MKKIENTSVEYHPVFGLTAGERVLAPHVQKSEWDYIWEKYSFHITLGSAIFFVSAFIFFMTTVFHLTDIAHAGSLQPNDVHTIEAACAYAGLYPDKVVNLDDLQIACADNGTPVQFYPGYKIKSV